MLLFVLIMSKTLRILEAEILILKKVLPFGPLPECDMEGGEQPVHLLRRLRDILTRCKRCEEISTSYGLLLEYYATHIKSASEDVLHALDTRIYLLIHVVFWVHS
jgi:hypothetical protein